MSNCETEAKYHYNKFITSSTNVFNERHCTKINLVKHIHDVVNLDIMNTVINLYV